MTSILCRALLLIGAALPLMLAQLLIAHSQTPARLKLRFLQTTDLHANVYSYGYDRDRADDTAGLAKTASLIATARADIPNALLSHNGDVIQGRPLGDFMAYSHGLKPGQVNPTIAAANELGHVCGMLGSHEFNHGLDHLGAPLAGQKFPRTFANALRPAGTAVLPPKAPRIRDLAFNGNPTDDAQEFLVATDKYRAGADSNFRGADGRTVVMEAPDLNRDVVVRSVVEQQRVDPAASGNWSLASWPKEAVISLLTGPGASAFRPAGMTVDNAGHKPDGSTKYRLGHAG